MQSTLYLCESSGARILAYAPGVTQQGTDFQVALETWEDTPMGAVGDNSFRTVDLVVVPENGYSIGITPVVDGVALQEQFFSGAGSAKAALQAFIAQRGAGLAVKVRTLSRTGDIDFQQLSFSYVPIRAVP